MVEQDVEAVKGRYIVRTLSMDSTSQAAICLLKTEPIWMTICAMRGPVIWKCENCEPVQKVSAASIKTDEPDALKKTSGFSPTI